MTETFADDVRRGLTAPRKHLPPKYFYDDLGSALFEAICELPEYYLTRTEADILERYAGDMVGPSTGRSKSSNSAAAAREKRVRSSTPRWPRRNASPTTRSTFRRARSSLRPKRSWRPTTSFRSPRTRAITWRCSRRRACVRPSASSRSFWASNIGNYEPGAAVRLLRAMSDAFKPGDALLLGTDLKKDASLLELAYNDPTGVTAAFDKNVLGRINRELGGRFDLDAFDFAARYDRTRGSVDSFLIANRGMTVPIERLSLDVRFRVAETIHTESSYKFDAEDIATLARRAGFSSRARGPTARGASPCRCYSWRRVAAPCVGSGLRRRIPPNSRRRGASRRAALRAGCRTGRRHARTAGNDLRGVDGRLGRRLAASSSRAASTSIPCSTAVPVPRSLASRALPCRSGRFRNRPACAPRASEAFRRSAFVAACKSRTLRSAER